MSTPVKPDITPYLEAIENAVYGEEVRGSIHDAIEAVNDYADEFYTDAQEQAQAAANSASSASGYATTASNKAGEASASATAAGNSATAAGQAETAAKNAKDSAVDASNLANTYAGNAASSAAQAAASAQAAAAAGPILVDTVGWMCKNRVPLTLESLKALNTLGTWADNVYTRNDVDFTVNTNSDGYVTSIVMNGTASGFASLTLLDDTIANLSEILPQGNYIVNGCPDGGAMLSGYSMRFKVDTETYYITDSDDMTVAVSGSSSYQVTWSLACTSGTSVSSKTFKPMIRKSAIADNTFEAYHKSVEDWYWENNAKTGVHNLLDPNYNDPNSYLSSGVGSVDANGVITLNGTQAAQSNYPLKSRDNSGNYIYLPKGNYKFRCKGCPNVLVGTTFNSSYSSWGQGESVTFTIDDNTKSDFKLSDGSVLVGLFVQVAAQTYSNVKWYPLLTDAADTYEEFSDYAMTNAELTEKVGSIEKITLTANSTYGEFLTANDGFCYKWGNMVKVDLDFKVTTQVPVYTDFISGLPEAVGNTTNGIVFGASNAIFRAYVSKANDVIKLFNHSAAMPVGTYHVSIIYICK